MLILRDIVEVLSVELRIRVLKMLTLRDMVDEFKED